MKIGAVLCWLLGLLAIFRGAVEAGQASRTTGSFFGYHPIDVLWPLIMGVLFVVAGFQLWKRAGAKSRENGS